MCRYISINSGSGSFDLALQCLHSWEVACYVEENPGQIALLEQRIRDNSLQDAPLWDDPTTFDGRPWHGLVDCIAGIGKVTDACKYRECSTASSDKLINTVREVEPSYILWQLSPAYKTKILASADYLANGLEVCGYRTAILQVRADDMGADHRRIGIFICAEVANSTSANRGDRIDEIDHRLSTACRATRWTANGRICRGTDGVAHRMERLNSLGISTVPAMVAAVSTILDTGVVF